MKTILMSRAEILQLTNSDLERNIYAHPNPLARNIFWQRLQTASRLIKKYARSEQSALDLGGGSGAFLPTLARYFRSVDVVDLDAKDADNIRRAYQLANVKIHEQDIANFALSQPFDIVVATDVLEHFVDLNVPLAFMKKVLRPHGLVAVTLPTENFIYELGRMIVRKTKPEDHYHASKDVLKTLQSQGFVLLEKRYCPSFLGIPIPLFEAAVLRKI